MRRAHPSLPEWILLSGLEQYWIVDPDLDHPKETHLKGCQSRNRSNLVKIKLTESEAEHSLLMTLYLLMKSRLSTQKKKQRKETITMFNSRSCDWLVLWLLLSTPTIWFLQDCKRRSLKQNQRKWKHSESSNFDSVELMIPTFDFH